MHDRKWIYKVETVKPGMMMKTEKRDAAIQDRLTRLGMEGWELVSTIPMGHHVQLFLKK